MELIPITLFDVKLEVECNIDKPSFGTYDCPGDNGGIDIQEVYHEGQSVYELVYEIPNAEEKICDEIRKTL